MCSGKAKWSFQTCPHSADRRATSRARQGLCEWHISAANLSDLETNGSRKRREWAYFSSGPDGVTGNISGSGKETSSLIVGQLKDALSLFLLISYAEKWCYLFSCEISLDGLLTTSWKYAWPRFRGKFHSIFDTETLSQYSLSFGLIRDSILAFSQENVLPALMRIQITNIIPLAKLERYCRFEILRNPHLSYLLSARANLD